MLIAEVGQNHCGDMELAKKLIKLAKEFGADLVKFQLYDHNMLYGDSDIPNVELSFDQAKMLFDYGKAVGIEVFFSVFDVERVEWCKEIGVEKYKIAYSQRRNKTLIDSIPLDKELFISGDGTEFAFFNAKYLYCAPHYPTPIKELCFDGAYFEKHITDFCEAAPFDGFSDHTIGLDVAKIAISRGAKIIEKHFAIDHKTGIDAPWSMTPDELKELRRFYDIVKEAL